MGGVFDIGDVGMWIKLGAPEVIDIAADTGYSFVIVDLEHSTLSLETAAAHIALGSARGLAVLVRVASCDSAYTGPILDAGARGIVVARVDGPDQAKIALDAMHFPPHGERGSGGTGRAGRWGLSSRQDYLEPREGSPLCVAQIESRTAIDHLPALLSTGIDAVLIGPADLRLSMHAEHRDDVNRAIAEALTATRDAGFPCGTAVGTGIAARAALDQGFDFVVAGADTSLLAGAAANTVTTTRSTDATL